MQGVRGLSSPLLDLGSEVNLMSLVVYKVGGWLVDTNYGWEVNSASFLFF